MVVQKTTDCGDDVDRKLFSTHFRITEQHMFDYCTNEIGKLLIDSNAAIIGNPLTLVSLKGINTPNKLLSWTGSATTLELNCTYKYMAISNGPSLSIFDLQKGAVLREFHDHDKAINQVTWHLTSPWLLASVGDDCTLRTWDLRSHPAQVTLRRTTTPYRCLKYSPDCNFIACAGQVISIFDMNISQSIVHMACNSPATIVCFNPTECLLSTASEDRVARFWDVDTGEMVTQSPAYDCSIEQMHFAEDGRYLIVGTGRQISSIRWEPFELISQITYPVQMQNSFPMVTAEGLLHVSKPTTSQANGSFINLLDLQIQNGQLYQLSTLNKDSTKRSAVVSQISLEQLENCGLIYNGSDTLDRGGLDEDIPPACPTTKNSLTTEEIDLEIDEGISPESEATSTTAESMLDSLTYQSTTTEQIKQGVSLTEVSNMSSHLSKYRPRKKQPDNNVNISLKQNKTINRLSTLGQSNLSFNESNPISSKCKSLIRRGSSLNDMSNCAVGNSSSTTNSANTNISTTVPLSKNNRSKSQAQQSNKQSKFSTYTHLSSSNVSSNSTPPSVNSPIGEQTKQNFEDSDDEDIKEFLQVYPRMETSIQKQTTEIEKLITNVAAEHENICEYLVEQTFRFEEPYMFSRLLKDYLTKTDAYNIGLNTVFLKHINALLSHRNKDYVQMALDFLEMVVTRFGDSIRHGLASKDFILGVDVAAEQRFDRSIRCKNALFQIRLNSAFIMDRMDSAQRRRFEDLILPHIDSIVDKSFKQSKN